MKRCKFQRRQRKSESLDSTRSQEWWWGTMQFSAARFTKSSKRKMTSKQLHLALLHCWLQSGYRKERREVHMVPWHGNSMCASLAEKKVNKKRREERKEENAAGQYTKCHKWKKTVLNKNVNVQVKDKKDKQKPGTEYCICCRYGQLGPGFRNSTGIPGSVIQVSHV